MADRRLINRPNSILGSKQPALICVKCYMWDSSGVSARPHVVRLVHQWPAKFSFPWLCLYVCDDTTVYCIGDTVDSAVTSLNRALSELNRWCLENSSTPYSRGKVRSNVFDEKTAHRAAKFCDYWWGSDRVGQTHSPFGRHYWRPAFLVKAPYRCKK